MIRARGKKTMYAPRVAAIAPGRPDRRHRRRPASTATWARRRRHAAREVEQQERDAAEAVLDVVGEDPQVEQVAQQVQPPAVEELAGDERRGLLRQVVAAPPGRGQVGRHDAPCVDERGRARPRRPLASRPSSTGERDDARDDDADRDHRRPARRVRVAQRDHGRGGRYGFLVGFGVGFGFVVAFGLADGAPDGLGDGLAVASSGTASSDRLVEAVGRDPPARSPALGVRARDHAPCRAGPPSRARGRPSRYCALYAPLIAVRLRRSRRCGRSARRRRTARPCRRSAGRFGRRRERVVRGRAEQVVAGRLGLPAVVLARDDRSRRPFSVDVDVAVDEQSVMPLTRRASVGEPGLRAWPGSPPPSAAGE